MASGPASASSSTAPAPPVVRTVGSGSSILVNPCQRGNPVLEHIRNVAKEWADIIPDFQLGRTTCALFLSIKYHRLHPEYIHQRIQRLAHKYTLRILLIHCDVTEHQDTLRELTRLCVINEFTIIVAWSAEECGFYLSAYKVYEYKPPDAIRERVDKDHMSVLRAALTGIRSVNKTDVTTLKTTFGSFAGIAGATTERLISCPGIGQTKARRIKDAFERPFHNRVVTKLTDVLPANASMGPPPAPVRRREPSPIDPDFDLAVDSDNEVEDNTSAPRAPLEDNIPLNPRKRPPRSPSPIWDIELDLNDDDMATEDGPPDPKRTKVS